ncbi:uncharacterized protein LOC102722260 [Oryza brachyantha]|uniref:PTM/DIR17-like Tudor domain-containing protein n=1 Tax=Oryza brachyantha TaxID=4533 RepID=J3L5K8_ORYBR|nr:uncharacterized protein LOC102722260 [Oryza brachyantha]
MEEIHGKQEAETASVVKVAREPAIIINGVPDLPPDCTPVSQSEPSNAAEPQVDHHFGESLEGRKVRKLFGDKDYVGKVVKYDSESNWYSVAYEDGDQEDLEWREVEEVLLPLDITMPLRTLILDKAGYQSAVPDSRPKVGRPRKIYAITEANTNRSLVPVSQGNNFMGNQMMTGAANEQSNNLLALIPASTSNDASAAGVNTQACVNASSQPRKRGRPRKNAIVPAKPANSQPKRRGRPPKNRNVSGNVQSVESTPNSLAIVPVDDASITADASRRQNSVLLRNAQTIRAEKLAKAERLKRENMIVQGTPPGTQFF